MTKAFKLKMIKDILEQDCNVESVELQDGNTLGVWFHIYSPEFYCYRLDDLAQDKLNEYGLTMIFNDCPGYFHEGMICLDEMCGHKLCE